MVRFPDEYNTIYTVINEFEFTHTTDIFNEVFELALCFFNEWTHFNPLKKHVSNKYTKKCALENQALAGKHQL